MDELFVMIGKLYYDLVRSQAIIESLKKQLEDTNKSNDYN
jgi:hypothetical protein